MIAALVAASLLLTAPQTERYMFAAKCLKIKADMKPPQVEAILGRPDEVIKAEEREALTWRYGVIRTGGFASFGTFEFFRGKLTFYPSNLPSRELPGEDTLRTLLQTLDDGGAPWPNSYEPLKIIRADNALIRLGRKQGLTVLREYIRVLPFGGSRGVFSIIQTVFEPSKSIGYVGGPSLGGSVYWPTKDERDAPYFPHLFYGDVPFHVSMVNRLGGAPERPEWYLKRVEKSSTFRAKLLHPTDTPWLAEGHLWQPSKDGGIESARNTVRSQVLRLVSTAYRPSAKLWDQSSSPPITLKSDEVWDPILAELKSVGIRWDESQEMYVRRDGSTIADIPRTRIYQVRSWSPKELAKLAGSIKLTRVDDKIVRVLITWTGGFDPWRGNTLEILSSSGNVLGTGPYKHPNAVQIIPDSKELKTRVVTVSLPPGEKVTLQLKWNGRAVRSKPIELEAMLAEG